MLNFSAIGIWILRLVAAVILLQTLYFKFSAAPESIYIFSKLGMEPWGRIGTGILELIAGTLLLIPATTLFGALLATGLMTGAIFFNITKLGIIYALLVFVSSIALIIIYRNDLFAIRGFRIKT